MSNEGTDEITLFCGLWRRNAEDVWCQVVRVNGGEVLWPDADLDPFLDEIVRLRGEVADLRANFHATVEPVGIRYCLTHYGTREADTSGPCDWHGRRHADETWCTFVELYPGVAVVDEWGEGE